MLEPEEPGSWHQLRAAATLAAEPRVVMASAAPPAVPSPIVGQLKLASANGKPAMHFHPGDAARAHE